MGIYPWNKFRYLTCEISVFFPPELILHNYKCGGYIPCGVMVNTHTIVNWKNSKIRPLITEYPLMIKLVDGTSSAHSFNPYAYFGHSQSYFDIQNLLLVILYIFLSLLNNTIGTSLKIFFIRSNWFKIFHNLSQNFVNVR